MPITISTPATPRATIPEVVEYRGSMYSGLRNQINPKRKIGNALRTIAEIRPSALFTDGVVLQRSVETRVWGSARPGSEVEVTLGE